MLKKNLIVIAIASLALIFTSNAFGQRTKVRRHLQNPLTTGEGFVTRPIANKIRTSKNSRKRQRDAVFIGGGASTGARQRRNILGGGLGTGIRDKRHKTN